MSIGMPVFNGMRYMERAVRSLLHQSWSDFELIIADNASTDGSYEFASSLSSDPRIRVVRNESNIGAIKNFIKVVDLARGEFFMWAPVDDYWEPEFVARLVAELDSDPKAGVAMSAARRVRESGESAEAVRFIGRGNPQTMGHLRLALELGTTSKCNFFINGLFRRPLLQRLSRHFPEGGAPERILLVQLALASGFRYVDEALYQRQLHDLKHEQRYPEEAYSYNVALGGLGDLQFLWSLLVTLATSDVVPPARKLYIPLIVARFAATRFGLHPLRLWRRTARKLKNARSRRGRRRQRARKEHERQRQRTGRSFPLVRTLVLDGKDFRFECYSSKELSRAKRLFTKEPGTIEWLSKTLRSDDVFFDIGANIGAYTIYAAVQIGESGSVYGFEPHVPTAASLLKNIEMNSLQKRVQVVSIPLAGQDGFGSFHYYSIERSISQSQFGRPVVSGAPFDPAASELKYGCRLDTLIEAGLVPRPSVIKIDVDGLEGEIIAGMERLLRSPEAPRSVQIELDADSAESIIGQMESAGYELVRRHWSSAAQTLIDGGLPSLSQFPHNAIFSKERSP